MEQLEEKFQGTFYAIWLRHFAEQMAVCVLVSLSVWTICKTPLINFVPLIIKPDDHHHVPHSGAQYQELATDICTIFFFAILFYFCLMFAVAKETREFAKEIESADGAMSHLHRQDTTLGSARSAGRRVMGQLSLSGEGAQTTEHHFVSSMQKELDNRQDPEMEEIARLLDHDIRKFPLWKYLLLNVRLNSLCLFEFSWAMWLPVICTFLCFTLLHRFAHMGYVRIMCFFIFLTLSMIGAMAMYLKALGKHLAVEEEADQDHAVISWNVKLAQQFNVTYAILCCFQFCLMFLCYGAARMVCQPWMWKLHFWTVLTLTILTAVQAFLFITMVSPAIPCLSASMALPPFLNPSNFAVMLHIARQATGNTDIPSGVAVPDK